MKDLAEHYGWDSDTMNQVAEEAGIVTLRRGRRNGNKQAERFFSNNEERKISRYIEFPHSAGVYPSYCEWNGIPEYLRIIKWQS